MWIKWDTQWCVLEMLCFLNCFLYVMYVNVLWPSGPPHFGLFGQSNLNKSSLRLGNCEEHFLQFLTFCRLNHYRPMIKKTLFRSSPDQQLPQISLDTVETVFQCNSCHLLSEIWSGCILLPLCSGWYWIFKCRQCQSQIRSHLYSLNDLGVSTITSQRECPGWLEWNLQSILVFSCFFFFFLSLHPKTCMWGVGKYAWFRAGVGPWALHCGCCCSKTARKERMHLPKRTDDDELKQKKSHLLKYYIE